MTSSELLHTSHATQTVIPSYDVPPPEAPADDATDSNLIRRLKRHKNGEVSVQETSSRNMQLCQYFKAGCCNFGDECWYSHDESLSSSDYKIMLCSEYARHGTCATVACRNAHGRSELHTPHHFDRPGYKSNLCTLFLLDDLHCDKAFQDCFDAHGPLDLRPDLPTLPPDLKGEHFSYSDSHVHLDAVLLARRYGSLWMHKRVLCKHDPCWSNSCVFAHGESDMRPRLPLDTCDMESLAAELRTHSDGAFGGCVHICCEAATIEETIKLVEWGKAVLNGRVFAAFGIHPVHYDDYTPEVEQRLEAALKTCGSYAVAWGECGLDYHHRTRISENGDVQVDPHICAGMHDVFIKQIHAAVRHRLPLVVHSRDAEEDVVQVLSDHLPRGHAVILHSYQGPIAAIMRFFDIFPNGYVGFTGVVTYWYAYHNQFRDLLRAIPISRILLETDGPWMSPEPHTGANAHAGHIPWIAHAVGKAKGYRTRDVLEATHSNFCRVFRIDYGHEVEQKCNFDRLTDSECV
eukprot:TRINITY_DN63362_c0_g1_i1.p1 TRINITY_DN63362_c0_g1~~TRINITY_DN63362_c0_g1_i1.p1  ORF type:complete len:518 (-),score=59.12 TRINITY_DN63362_c0_g1_i1:316-1869(-)